MGPLKKCNHCSLEANTEEDLELFVKCKSLKYGRRNTCKVCGAKASRKAQGYTEPKKSAPKGTYSTVSGQCIWNRYGLSEENYKNFLEVAGNKCELCETTENLVIDHCHYTNTLRGVLCASCNSAISPMENFYESFESKIIKMKKMIEYVENHKLISHTLPTIEDRKNKIRNS